MDKCTKEITNFATIYPDWKDKVAFALLNGFACVVMPFFEPIQKGARKDQLVEIEECLTLFQKKKMKYQDEDVCWRHVGKYQSKIILFDLADLIPADAADSTLVKNQITILSNRMGQECESTSPQTSI
jgi:hypothetical protein